MKFFLNIKANQVTQLCYTGTDCTSGYCSGKNSQKGVCLGKYI